MTTRRRTTQSVRDRPHVPFYDHAREFFEIRGEIEPAILRVLESGSYHQGQEVRAFEEEFAEFCGTRYAVTTGSCYDAMFRSLLALGIGPGDEVITVPNTEITCAAVISHTGASIVWTDTDEETYNIDPEGIEEKITPRTKAIIIVHMYGHPADTERVMDIASRHGLFVIEDAAIAVGARFKGQRVGCLGHVGCFSHAASKILSNYGEGGTAVTNDSSLAEKIRRLFIYTDLEDSRVEIAGQKILERFWFSHEGYHGRMVELTAAVLRTKLSKIDGWISERRRIAAKYNGLLSGSAVVTPKEAVDARHVYRNYAIRVRNRDLVRRKLAERGIETGIHYAPPLHLQPVYSQMGYRGGSFPVTERTSAEIVTLPIYPQLTSQEIELVCSSVKAVTSELAESSVPSRLGRDWPV